MSLVELIVVISIMAVMTGILSLGIGMMFSRDASYVAVRIDDMLSEARTVSMSKAGTFTCSIHIDGTDPKNSYAKITDESGNVYKEVILDKSVTVVVKKDGTAVTGDFAVEFDKAKGSVKKVNGSDSDIGKVYTIDVTSTKNTSKTKTVTLVSTTGRHYTDK